MRRGFFLLILLSGINSLTYSQITRGTLPGEIYISTVWYFDIYGYEHAAIFYSQNHGVNNYLKYDNAYINPKYEDEMVPRIIIGDATPGVLYDVAFHKLWAQIWFKLAEESSVSIAIYDYTGKCIRSFDKGVVDKRLHYVEFSAEGLPSGI